MERGGSCSHTHIATFYISCQLRVGSIPTHTYSILHSHVPIPVKWAGRGTGVLRVGEAICKSETR